MTKIPVYLSGRDRNAHASEVVSTLSALEKINHHKKDDGVRFEEIGHKYYIGDKRTEISCTEAVHLFFQEADKHQMVTSKMSSVAYRQRKCAEAGMSYDEILEYWSKLGDESRDFGTEMHSIIEFLLNCRILKNEDSFELKGVRVSKEISMFETFYKDFCIKSSFRPYRTEWLIYDEKIGFAGSIDALFVSKDNLPNLKNIKRCDNDFRETNKKNKYWLLDWKRSKAIYTSSRSQYGKYCKVPDSKIPNCNYYHYTLQLNIYRRIIESYGLEISGMMLVIIHPNNSEYQAMTVPFIDYEAKYIIENAVEEKKAIKSRK